MHKKEEKKIKVQSDGIWWKMCYCEGIPKELAYNSTQP